MNDTVRSRASLGASFGFGGRLSKQMPSQIIVDVTEQCNLHCVHCASPAFRKSSLYSGANLDQGLNEKLCREVAEDGAGVTRYLRYSASGEPLLHPDLDLLLRQARILSGALVTMTTNGVILDGARAEQLLRTEVDLIDISIDAFSEETYTKVRAGGSLERTRENVIGLLRAKRKMGASTKIVVSFIDQPHNTDEKQRFSEYWQRQGVDRVVIRRFHSNAGAKRAVARTLQLLNEGEHRRPCLYPWERMVLGPTGLLGFCPADWSHQASFVDFRTTTIRDSWQGTYMAALRAAHQTGDFSDPRFKLCANCPDWSTTRWPSEGTSYADMVVETRRAPEDQVRR